MKTSRTDRHQGPRIPKVDRYGQTGTRLSRNAWSCRDFKPLSVQAPQRGAGICLEVTTTQVSPSHRAYLSPTTAACFLREAEVVSAWTRPVKRRRPLEHELTRSDQPPSTDLGHNAVGARARCVIIRSHAHYLPACEVCPRVPACRFEERRVRLFLARHGWLRQATPLPGARALGRPFREISPFVPLAAEWYCCIGRLADGMQLAEYVTRSMTVNTHRRNSRTSGSDDRREGGRENVRQPFLRG